MVTRGYSWLLVVTRGYSFKNAEIFRCVRGYSCIYVSQHVSSYFLTF